MLDRHGLVKRGGGPRHRARGTPLSQGVAPNDLWCADLKGEFKLGNGRYCYPLTVTDHASRFLLLCEALDSTREEPAITAFERLFRDRGLPLAIRSDNGVPFASPNALFNLSKLSVWWLRLGIAIERIKPGHPQQNGRHERMHLTLKKEATRPPGFNSLQQQERFDEIGNRVMLQSVLEHQIAHSERLHQEQLQRQEREDWSEVLDEAVPYLAELPGIGDPRKEATRWLLSQAQLDPRLAEAWQHRRDSPQHQAHAVSVIKRAYKTMHAELSRRPDADLTEDRWAVAAFMRGGSKTPPPAKVPDYSKMTEAQLAAEWAKVGTHPATAPG